MNNIDGIIKRVLKNKKALSTVVTTLIILVVSVLLATVVTFYAINVTTTRVQEENLQIYKQHIWHNGSNFAEAAFIVSNTGGRDVVIDKISVRGQECLWTTIYFNKTGNTIYDDLLYITPNSNGTLVGKSVVLGKVPVVPVHHLFPVGGVSLCRLPPPHLSPHCKG